MAARQPRTCSRQNPPTGDSAARSRPDARKEAAAERARHHRLSSPATPESAPTALMHSLKHYKVLHEQNVILTVGSAPAPRVGGRTRANIERIWSDIHARCCCGLDIWRHRTFRARWQSPVSSAGQFDIMSTSSSCRVVRSGQPRVQECRAGRIAYSSCLARSANDATDYCSRSRTGRVVEVGTQVTIKCPHLGANTTMWLFNSSLRRAIDSVRFDGRESRGTE